MKFEKDNLTGKQARRILQAVVAMWQGTPEQADAIRFGGDSKDVVYDLMGLKSLPGIKLGPPDTRSSSRGTPSQLAIGVDDFDNVMLTWGSPRASYESDESLGVIMRIHRIGRDKNTPALDVVINLNDDWKSDVYPHDPVAAFFKVLLGDNV